MFNRFLDWAVKTEERLIVATFWLGYVTCFVSWSMIIGFFKLVTP